MIWWVVVFSIFVGHGIGAALAGHFSRRCAAPSGFVFWQVIRTLTGVLGVVIALNELGVI
jgi:hypothetical protein